MSENKKKEQEQQEEKEDQKDQEEPTLETEEVQEDQEDQEEESLKYSFMRLQADFDNFRKRVDQERAQQIRLANEGLIMKLLPVMDDLERALANTEEDEFSKGIRLILNSFQEVLASEGLEEIVADGADFDPNLHHAVLTEESDQEENTILETLQKGYTLNDKVIRPSMVKVSK